MTRWRSSCATISRNCLVCGEAGTGMTTKAGGLTPSHARRRGPIKTGWTETDKGQPRKPNVRARSVAKENKTHARPELYASTPPLEALRLVLLEIATGNREGKVVALVDVRRAYFYAPSRRRPQRITRQAMTTCLGCCGTACTAHATPRRTGRRSSRRRSASSN